MPELNTQSRLGLTLHYDGAAQSAPTSLLGASAFPSDAHDVSRHKLTHLRAWTCDNANDSWTGGGIADLYIIGYPHPASHIVGGISYPNVQGPAELIAAFEITGATSSDTALAHFNSQHPILSDISDNSDFYECLDVDFAGVFAGGDIPARLSLVSSAGESLTSGALDGVAPLSFLIDVLAYRAIKVIPANFSGTGFDRIVIGLHNVE